MARSPNCFVRGPYSPGNRTLGKVVSKALPLKLSGLSRRKRRSALSLDVFLLDAFVRNTFPKACHACSWVFNPQKGGGEGVHNGTRGHGTLAA